MVTRYQLHGLLKTGDIMAEVLQHKVVASLPSSLEPDSVYYVKVGAAVDIYVTNSNGIVVAYPINAVPGSPPPIIESTPIDITVGAGGDFETINGALNYLSKMALAYTPGQSARATITLLSGFVMEEQVLVFHQDLSWITILSEDAIVPVDATKITTSVYTLFPVFACRSASLPVIGAFFKMINMPPSGIIAGVMAVEQSAAVKILADCGFDGATYGCYAHHGASIQAGASRFINSTEFGMFANRTSRIAAYGADCRGSGTNAFYSSALSAIDAAASVTTGSGRGYVVNQGGVLLAAGTSGTTNIAVNTYTQYGIIYK